MTQREKQIEEMACAMCGQDKICGGVGVEKCIIYPGYRRQANRFYNAGYRKQREGEWEMQEFPLTKCSVCGTVRNCEKERGWKFCPECGAKMKGE